LGEIGVAIAAPYQWCVVGKVQLRPTLDPRERIQVEQSEIITFHDYSWAEVFRKASPAPRALPSAHHLHRVHGAIGTDLAQDANQFAPGRPGLGPMCWKNQLSGFTIFSTSDLRPTSAQGVKLLREFTGKSASTQGIQIFFSLARNRSPWCTRLADHPEG
jgi:hypothetical protein